jgi:hypothetical protein
MNLSRLFTLLNLLKFTCAGNDWWSQFKPNHKYGLYRAFDSDDKNIFPNLKSLRKYYPTYFCRVYTKDKPDPGFFSCMKAKACKFRSYNKIILEF